MQGRYVNQFGARGDLQSPAIITLQGFAARWIVSDPVSRHNLLMRLCVLLVLSLCLHGWPLLSKAQDLSPRAYWPAPTGTQVLTLGVSHTSGDIIPDPSLPLTGLDSDITVGYVGYLRTLDLFGRSSNLILELPYASGDTVVRLTDRDDIRRSYDGVGDVAATLSVNLLGAPAMDAQGFAELRAEPRPIVGASLKVVAPTGAYDEKRLVNVGANRWSAKAEVGSMLVLHQKWLLELGLGAWMFGDNDDFLGVTRKQDPIYSVEAHLVRRFSPGFWMSLDLTGYRGGRSEIGDRKLDDLQRDSKIGATVVFPFAHKHAVKFRYSTGSINDSDESFDLFQLSYQRLL